MNKIKNKNSPLVTIGILSFTRINDLKETLEKLQDITYPNLEIVIVDNGSNDGSQEFIRNYLEIEIKYFFLEKNLGVGLGRLKIFDESKGDYIFSIDEDCYLKFDIIEKTINLFENNLKLGAIGFMNVNPNSFVDKNLYYQKSETDKKHTNIENRYEGALSLCSSAWKKDILNKINYKALYIQKLNLIISDDNSSTDTSKILLSTEIEADLSYLLCSNGYNSFIASDLIAFHKISPSNRNKNFLIQDGILRCFRMTINYSPYSQILKELFFLIYRCVNTFLNSGNFIYLFSILISIFSRSNNIYKYKRINLTNYRKMRKINIEPILGIDDKVTKS